MVIGDAQVLIDDDEIYTVKGARVGLFRDIDIQLKHAVGVELLVGDQHHPAGGKVPDDANRSAVHGVADPKTRMVRIDSIVSAAIFHVLRGSC